VTSTTMSESLQGLLTSLSPLGRATPMTYIDEQDRRVTTLGVLIERAERVAGGLRKLGVGSRDAVAMQLPHREEALIVQFATWMLDAVFVPIVPVYGSAEVEQVLADARPVIFISQDHWRNFDYASNWSKISQDLRPSLSVFLDSHVEGSLEWSDLELGDPLVTQDAQDPDDVAVIIYTSGSTGVPKGVKHSARGLLAEARNTDYRPHRSADDIYLQISAAGHVGGILYSLRSLVYSMQTIILDGWSADLVARVVDSDRPSAMVCTPFHIQTVVELAAKEGWDLSSLDLVCVGGAPVTPHLVRAADNAGVIVVRSYGMSEHPTITLGDPSADVDSRASTDGKLTPGTQLRLVDEFGQVVPAGEAGEIEVRGPEQFLGYTNVPDSEAFSADHWFKTGDIGTVDEDGNVTVVDRKKNIIIRGGENLSATEIEHVVSTHPDVQEVAVIGIPDARYGERVCAFIITRDGRSVTLESLMEHFLDQGVAKQKVPEAIELVDSLPRTGNDKVEKKALLALREERQRASQ
jgi:cyclohexanecarboxylate-CoA ligase